MPARKATKGAVSRSRSSVPPRFRKTETTTKGFKVPMARRFGDKVFLVAVNPDGGRSRKPGGYTTKAQAQRAAERIRKVQRDSARVVRISPGKYVVYSWNRFFRTSLGGRR